VPSNASAPIFIKTVGARVYYITLEAGTYGNVMSRPPAWWLGAAASHRIDPDNAEMEIAYPNALFARNIIDGRGMMCYCRRSAVLHRPGERGAEGRFERCSTATSLMAAPPSALCSPCPSATTRGWATWSTARSATSTSLRSLALVTLGACMRSGQIFPGLKE
jgi:hypothetical protein